TGSFVGSVITKYFDYDAFDQRKKIKKFNSKEEYIEDLDERLNKIKILGFKISNLDSLDMPLIEELTVKIDGFDGLDANKLIINPFIFNQISVNPFKLAERTYPVDFGSTI